MDLSVGLALAVIFLDGFITGMFVNVLMDQHAANKRLKAQRKAVQEALYGVKEDLDALAGRLSGTETAAAGVLDQMRNAVQAGSKPLDWEAIEEARKAMTEDTNPYDC